MRLIDPKKIPKMGEPTTLEDAPMYEFAQCLIDYLVENYGIDVPDIVRCKDCKHFAYDGMAVIHDTGYYCTRPNQQSCNLVPEDYCSYAERKEVEE